MRHAHGCLVSLLLVCACEHRTLIPGIDAHYSDGSMSIVDAGRDGGPPPPPDAGFDAFVPIPDAGPLDPDAACASATVQAEVERLPVDIIWVVDNSASMAPAIEAVQAGLNDFAALIGGRSLDYRVIMLSLRGRGEISRGGSRRYQVCIPEPLAGDADCGDGASFFQVEVDIHSTQPIEQLLGTLGQTVGYTAGTQHGSAPWIDLLRPEATKTIVVVSDDNARMVVRSGSSYVPGPGGGRFEGDPVATVDWFETKDAGASPFTASRGLPEGVLHARWGGLFDGYTASAIYGWGSETDPSVRCEYPDGAAPDAPGPTYTELVRRTGGVRAQICDGASAWGPFFDAVASAVERTSRIDCTIPIPPPPDGSFFQRDRINVFRSSGETSERIGKVGDASGCDGVLGGWYYDDDAAPMNVVLCPTTCEAAQPVAGGASGVDVQFGCQTIPI